MPTLMKSTPLVKLILPRLLLFGLLFLGPWLSAQKSLQETLDSAKSLRWDRADEKEVLLRKCLNLLDNESDSLHFLVEFALGRLCYYTGQLDSSYVHFTAAQDFTGDSSSFRCNVLNSRGATLHRWGRPKEATALLKQGIELSRAINDSSVIPMLFNNLANCQQDLGNLENAKKYIMRAIDGNARLRDSVRLARNYNNLGLIFSKLDAKDSARFYYELSLEMGIKQGLKPLESTLKANLAGIYFEDGAYEKSELFYKEALKLKKKNNFVEGYNLLLVELIELYLQTDRLEDAEELIDQFEEEYVGKDEFKHAARVEKCKGDYFTALGKTKEAQIHFERSVAFKDSLYMIHSDAEIHELEASLRRGMQQEEVQLLSDEKGLREKSNKRIRAYLIVLLACVSLLAVSLVSNRQKAKQNARLSRKYQEEKDRAEDNAMFKEQSMNILSHEVRTPINGIINLTEFLKCQCPNDELHEMVEMIETSAVRLNNVVMNVLNMAKFQAGRLEMDLLPTDVVEICKQAVASFAHSAKLELLHLDYEGSEKPVHCLLDAQLLHSILNNLIGNSLKFTPSGGHIVVSVEQEADQGIIRVRDTGAGMTQEQVKKIFDPYQQVSEEKQKRRVGTGLGLSIVSQFTELMSGTVDVESKKGEGTTFTLNFPLHG